MNLISFSIVFFSFVAISLAQNATKPKTQPSAPSTPPVPTINWGKCPQLEPSDKDKRAKGMVLEECLKENPIPKVVEDPKNITEESVLAIEKHQRSIAECALKKEKWFTKSGAYKFSKAETEIKNKKLEKGIETDLVKDHKKCEKEAKDAFKQKSKVIEQVQLYQACMDFHITQTCQIQVTPPQ